LEYKIESGLRYPFKIFRFNSWQAYDALSSIGYTINLNVSGNIAPILDAEKYKLDKWGHLKPYSKFETNLYNPVTDKSEILPVNSVVTDKETDKEGKIEFGSKYFNYFNFTDKLLDKYSNEDRSFTINGYKYTLPSIGVENALTNFLIIKSSEEDAFNYNNYTYDFTYFVGDKNTLKFKEIENLKTILDYNH
jgi:hypothetical protein